MFCMAHADVLDFNESQSFKRVQAHLGSTIMHKHHYGQMKGKGRLSTDLAPQHGRKVYANIRKDKVKRKCNLSWGLNGIFDRDMITDLYLVKVIQQFLQIVTCRGRKPTAPFQNRYPLGVNLSYLHQSGVSDLSKCVNLKICFSTVFDLSIFKRYHLREQTTIDGHQIIILIKQKWLCHINIYIYMYRMNNICVCFFK